jgi:HK97 family phage major capsid protein
VINALKQKRHAVLTKSAELAELIVKENRGFSAEEKEQYDRMTAEMRDYTGQIESLEKAEELRRQILESKGPTQEPAKEEKRGFDTFGEFAQAVALRADDSRLAEFRASGLNEGVPADGGFFVQKDFANQLIKAAFDTGVVGAKCRRFPLSSNANGIKIPAVDETSRADGSRRGGVRGYWANEAATVTASDPKFAQIELTLNKLFCLGYITEELLQDASAMDALLNQLYAEEIGFKLDDAIINGDGAGKPLGIMSAGCLVTVAKETGQAADTILYENIVKMWSRLIATSRGNAVWFINQDVEPQLYSMVLSAGTGGVPVYLPASGLSGSMYGTLFGRPVVPIEQCDTVGDLGDIILADMSQYYLIDKGGVQAASSIHVKFIYDEMAFRMTYRVDGQPAWKSAITPYKSSNTLSPFVTLAERA